jgi:hypothetical protein
MAPFQGDAFDSAAVQRSAGACRLERVQCSTTIAIQVATVTYTAHVTQVQPCKTTTYTIPSLSSKRVPIEQNPRDNFLVPMGRGAV